MKKGEKKTGLIGVRLEPDLMAEVERYAEAEQRPAAAMARILISEAVTARRLKQAKKKP